MAELQTLSVAGRSEAESRRGVSGALDAWLGAGVETIAAALVAAEIAILFGGVVARYVFDRPLVWSDELASILFLWLAMFGAVIAFRRDEHMRMTAVIGALAPPPGLSSTCSRRAQRSPSCFSSSGRPTIMLGRKSSSRRRPCS